MSSPDRLSQSTRRAPGDDGDILPAVPDTLWTFAEGLLEGCLVLDKQNRVLYINRKGIDYLRSLGGTPLAENFDAADASTDSRWARIEEFLPESWMQEIEKRFRPSRSDLSSLISEHPAPESTGVLDWRLRFSTDGRIRYLFFRPSQNRRDESLRVRELESELAELQGTMKLSQELLRSSNQKLNEAVEKQQEVYAQLVDSTQLKSEFLANTSHELRTPLNAIIGFLQMIMDELYEDEDERDRFTRNAFTSAEHLLDLINDVLDMAKIESGVLNLSIQPVDAKELFDGLEDMFGMQTAERGLKLDFAIDSATAGTVLADPSRLRQVLINLIGNSIKFTDEGSITVSFSPYPDDPETIVFSIKDTGIGIAPVDHKKIFEKFAQVDGTSTRQAGGAGLGLTISKTLVELMDGQIWLVQSGKGKGTTISFSLPSAACNSDMKPAGREEARTVKDKALPLDF